MGTIVITQQLIDAGIMYKKEILAAPLVSLDSIIKYFSTVTGVQGKYVSGWLNVAGQLRPYRTAKDVTGSVTITPEEMENYLGDLVQEFDPSALYETLYKEPSGVAPTKMQMAAKIATTLALMVGQGLHDNLFTAVRNASGETTADLFNGFETLLANAIIAGSISAPNGNYQDLTADSISESNCGDILKNAWRSLNRIIKNQKVQLLVPETVLDHYEDWYQNEYSTQAFNTGVTQRFLVGSRERCELVPMNSMSGDYMIFSIPQNMKLILDGSGDKEDVKIRECDNPKLMQFFMKAYFGVGFETVQKEFMCAAKISVSE